MLVQLITTFAAMASAAAIHRRAIPSGVPSFAIKYAPVNYLYTGETYFPSDIGAQLTNTKPEVNYTVITSAPKPLTLNNLNALNKYGDNANYVYLTSIDNVATNPAWLNGVKPDSSGETDGAVSSAVIVNDHGSGLVDVFYFYFYAFNYGGEYFGFVIGDHVGDWEHTMVRFLNGKPQAMWYSQHSNGEAFTYECLEKYDSVRPVVYVANGTHANYAITGTHDHTIPDVNLPKGPIEDYTDKGAFWDPLKSAYYFSYSASTQKFTAYDSSTPVNWLYYLGRWGDKQYPDSDPRQQTIFNIPGLYKYTDGPTGPEDKQLNRTQVCPSNGIPCVVSPVLRP